MCHTYFLYIIFYAIVAILFDLHSQNWIYISLFELVVTCIETHIFVTILSISHIFISVIKFFCCFLLLVKLFNSNIKYSKRCIQHNIYTIFEQISIFLLCIFSHTQIQCVTLPTREGVFILHFSGQEDFCISICFINQGLNAPLLSHCARPCRYCWKMRCMFPRVGYQFLEGILHISGTVHGA